MREFPEQRETLGHCRGGAGGGCCCSGGLQVAHPPPGACGVTGYHSNADFSSLPSEENSKSEDKWENLFRVLFL